MINFDRLVKTVTVTGLLSLMPVLMPVEGGSEVSESENRALTTFEEVLKAPAADKGQAVSQYVEDNIPIKKAAKEIAAETAMNVFGISSNDDVIVGNDGWFYFIDSVMWHTKETTVSSEDLSSIRSKLSALSGELASHGARLVLFIAPDKETVYPEYLPESVTVSHENTDKMVKALSQSGVEVIFPRDELISYKNAYQLYAKRDTHWLSTGAYIASYCLTGALGVENPCLESLTMYPKPCEESDLSGLLGVTDLYEPETDYDYSGYGLGRSMPYTYSWGEYGDGKSVHTDGAAPVSVYILRDSFFNAMEPFVTISFEESFIRHFDHYIPGEISAVNPDIVIIEVCERSLMRLKDIIY